MPFRGSDDTLAVPTFDPLARFFELHEHFDADRGRFGDRVPLRLAAVTLITAPGQPEALVYRTRAADAQLAEHFGWLSDVDAAVRLVLAAALVRTDESPDAFVATLEHARALMRAAVFPRGGVHEVLAILALQRAVAGREIEAADIDRMKAIYDEMKHFHWFLTGADDYTACAMLIGKPGIPLQIVDHVEAIYRRLARAPKTWAGGALQTAANVLALVTLTPDEAANRFLEVADALRTAGIAIKGAEYDEVAVLSFVPRSAEGIAQMVVADREQLMARLPKLDGGTATSLAANLTFVRLVLADDRKAALGDAKLLLDMQAIASARQAAAVAAIAATS